MSQRIPPAIYQFFPFGTQEKILLEDATDGIYFDFQEATADDKLYIQLFDFDIRLQSYTGQTPRLQETSSR